MPRAPSPTPSISSMVPRASTPHVAPTLKTAVSACAMHCTGPRKLRQVTLYDIEGSAPHCCRAHGNVRNDQRIRGDYSTIADDHGANDARVAPDDDVVAYGSSA